MTWKLDYFTEGTLTTTLFHYIGSVTPTTHYNLDRKWLWILMGEDFW